MSKKKKKIRKPRFIRFAQERSLCVDERFEPSADDNKSMAQPATAPPPPPQDLQPIVLEPQTEIPLDHAEDPVSIAEDLAVNSPDLEEVDAVPKVITACMQLGNEWWLHTLDANGDLKPTDGPFEDFETCEAMRPDRGTNITDQLP